MFKSKLICCLVLCGLLLNVNFVFAELAGEEVPDAKYETQEYLEDEVAIIEPGVLPNSFWYWGDIFAEEIRYIFTVTKKSKGDYLIQTAEERLAELRELSEQGITKYAEKLISKHEQSIKLATQLYKKAKVQGWEQLQQGQTDLEKEILLNEAKLKVKARKAPADYEKGRDSVIGQIGTWVKNVVSHLKWKRGVIKEQRAEVLGEE